MPTLASALPDIELVPERDAPSDRAPAAPPPWKAPPPPEIERVGDGPRDPRPPPRRPPEARPSRRPPPLPVARDRRPPPPAPAARPAAPPVPRPAARSAPVPPARPVATAGELEVPAFLALPRARAPEPAPAPAVAPRAAVRRGPPPLRRARPRWGRIVSAGAAVLVAVGVLTGIGISGGADPAGPGPAALGLSGLTPAAAAEIPGDYLRLYVRFGREMDIDWRFLAAIGGQESDHGRHPAAARVNRSGCVGPMQLGVGGRCGDFVAAWGVDGDGDGRVDPQAPADAIATAAKGLREGKGAPAAGGPYLAYRRAACAYYGACADPAVDYADEVMERAVRYGLPPG